MANNSVRTSSELARIAAYALSRNLDDAFIELIARQLVEGSPGHPHGARRPDRGSGAVACRFCFVQPPGLTNPASKLMEPPAPWASFTSPPACGMGRPLTSRKIFPIMVEKL